MFGNKGTSSKNSMFGDIGTVQKGAPKSYLENRGRYLFEVREIAEGTSQNKKSNNYGIAYCRATLRITESQAVDSENPPHPVGYEGTMIKFFGGKRADYDKADWRQFACAILGVDDSKVDWDDPEEAGPFITEFQNMIDNPDEYVGKTGALYIEAREVVGDDGEVRVFTNHHFSPVG